MIPKSLVSQLIFEPADTYHAQSKENLSSHRLADFRKCPLLYHWKLTGLAKDEDSSAYLIGRATHTMILEGRQKFDAEYIVSDGPINPQTGKPFGSNTKAYAQWLDEQSKAILTAKQAHEIEMMAEGVMAHPLAKQLLVLGTAESVVRTRWQNVDCQIRIDWLSHMLGAGIVDLKTTGDLNYFEADARRFGYVHQLAFYRSVAAAAAMIDPRDLPVHLIAIEKSEPYRCGVWRMGEDVLAIAQRENEDAVKRLRQCRQSNVWPTGFEELRTFDWM
jgi:hypothetical protein